MRAIRAFLLVILMVIIASCESMQSSSMLGPRTVTLDGDQYSEQALGKFSSWRCKDFVRPAGILVEVGYFTEPLLTNLGFVLYDGGNVGSLSLYRREGLNHRWDWGQSANFSFIVKPDGTGLYYDFSSVPQGERIKANDVYRCTQ